MLCRDWSLVHRYEGGICAIPLCCRSWTCDYCAPKRRRDVIALGAAGNPNRLITITVNPALLVSPAARAAALANAWRLVVKRAKRAFGWKELDYLAVFERTKLGEPHLHILARCGYLPQAWLSQQLKELIGAPIVDIRQVKGGKGAARYVAKYLGKDPHRFATCKRYWHTKNWVPTAQAPDDETSPEPRQWEIVEKDLIALRFDPEFYTYGIPIQFNDLVFSGRRPDWTTVIDP